MFTLTTRVAAGLTTVSAALLAVMLTATGALAKEPLAENNGDRVQPTSTPDSTAAQSGFDNWYVVAVVVGVALVAMVLAVVHHRGGYRWHHSRAAV